MQSYVCLRLFIFPEVIEPKRTVGILLRNHNYTHDFSEMFEQRSELVVSPRPSHLFRVVAVHVGDAVRESGLGKVDQS